MAVHGPRKAQVARTHGRRPCVSTWMPVRGAMWQSEGSHLKGPRVSGPWLGLWGGNENALPRPNIYTHDFLFLIPCGTMFRGISLLQATWQHHGRQIRSRGVDRVDPSPRDRNQNMCAKSSLSDGDRRLTCRHVDAMGAPDSHRTCDRELPHDLHRMARWRKITNHD